MWGLAPLVMRLLVVSLVALALAHPGGGKAKTDLSRLLVRITRPPRPTMPLPRARPQNLFRMRRTTSTTTTTTTSTIDPKNDDHEPTQPPITTTADPRTFDHTEVGKCDVPLGMQNGMISNESLTASSSYDQSVSPLSSRIRTEIRGGAWCPNGLIGSTSHQFLEIDLQGEYLVTATESQGRFANSVGVEFVQNYQIEYWRDAVNRWSKYKDYNGSRLIPGNVNTYTPKKSYLEAPFVASKIRFLPYADHPRTSCMRVEIYGCLWKQGIVAYSAPVGGHMPTMTNGARFEDLSYDGHIDVKRLTDGLGQLTDSLYGPDDFEIADPADTGGSRWVGWNRSMLMGEELELTFNFSDPRQLQFVDIHTNNMFTKDVQLFNEAEVYFSLEGERWQEDFISYEPKQDRVAEHARIVHIDLENRTAKHVSIKLKFQHEWILISEITFKSVPTVINSSAEFIDEYYNCDSAPSSKAKRDSTFRLSIGLACGGLVGGGAILGTLGVYITKRLRRRLPNILSKQLCPNLRGGNANARNNRRAPRLAMALANCPPIHMMRPAVVDEDYREPYNIWKETLGRRDKRVNNADQNEYNEICEATDFPPRPYLLRRPEPQECFYATTDIIHHAFPEDRHLRRERPVPGLFTSIKLPEADPPNGVAPLLDFPRGRMRLITNLGDSLHGNLQICETDQVEPLSEDDGPTKNGRRRIVVVKTLWRGCHNSLKAAFAREATWGAGLKHPQLARVLGLSLLEPPCAALDRGDAAPLPTILRMNRKLSYSSLIHICCQIAAGMKYLESFELVHRDLAARSITVTKDLNVKIVDYAMFCEEFLGEYHIMVDGCRFPIRWMAWESLLLGAYSPSSDVWSFGVTVWEILTYCVVKPYEEMKDEQVLANANEWRCGGRGARVPAAPSQHCRRELYDLMHECWQRDPEHRPRFCDLHRYLGRMSHGYKPPRVQ